MPNLLFINPQDAQQVGNSPTKRQHALIARDENWAGFVGAKHFHPGNVFVYVLEGEFTVETEKGTLTVRAGELYPEVPDMVMRAKNPSTSVPTKLLVFQVGDTGKPMMVKAK